MITEEEANEWVHNNKERHKWVTSKMLSEFANDKVSEVVKQIHSQSKDEPITPKWVGFNPFL
jgi:hypothetical protein